MPEEGNVVYTSRQRLKHDVTLGYGEVYLDDFDTPIVVGHHGIIKKHLHTLVHPRATIPKPETIHSLEYVAAALAASSIEAVGDALEARGVSLEPDGLTAEVEGDFEREIGWLRPEVGPLKRVDLLSRIHIRYHLKVPRGKLQIAEEVLQAHLQGNSIFQSIQQGIKGYFDWEIEEAD